MHGLLKQVYALRIKKQGEALIAACVAQIPAAHFALIHHETVAYRSKLASQFPDYFMSDLRVVASCSGGCGC
jgi:hypothetical protein